MDWYCSLTEHLLKPDNLMIGKESFQSVQRQLEARVVALYKVLLLYQMKSACSFYQHQVWVFVRGLANLDNWDADLKSVTDTEGTLLKDWDQFNKEQAQSLRRQHVEIAEKMETLLGDIHYGVQENTAMLKEIHRDEEDTQCLKDLRPTDPRHDKTRIEQTNGGLLADSYRWILDSAEFRRWSDDEQSRLLWIKGDPGKGKTMLLCGIIDELTKRSAETDVLSFFFCQATDARINNATAVLRSLVYLLLDQQPSLIPHARTKYDHAGKALFEDTNAWVAVSEIFTNVLQDPALKRAYLVIDALDECVTDLPKLLDFIVQKSSTSPRVKWIVSSRNWLNIEERLQQAGQSQTIPERRLPHAYLQSVLSLELQANAESVSRAVNSYIDYKILQIKSLQDEDEDSLLLREHVRRVLRQKAEGTFLWVALVVQELEGVESWDVRQVVDDVPQGLDDLYARMIKQIQRLERRDPEFCRLILSAAALANRPLQLLEMGVISGLPDAIAAKVESIQKIVKKSGSFLTIREDTIYFVHQSAQDYLAGKAASTIFPSGRAAAHHNIFQRSLDSMSKSLRRDIYGLHHPGISVDDVKVPAQEPLAAMRYSCVYWVDHLADMSTSVDRGLELSDLQDNDIIYRFLYDKYLHWLEALGLLGSIPEGIVAISKLTALLVSSFAISCVLSILILYHREQLRRR